MINRPEFTIHDLARQAQTGDAEAMEELFGQTYPLLQNFGRSFFRDNPYLADDATAEASVLIFQRIDTFDPARGSFKGWAVGIMRHTAVELIRRESKHSRRLAFYLGEEVKGDQEKLTRADTLIDTARDRQPEEAYFALAAQRLTHQKINQIDNPDQKTVLELSLAGLTNAEIAEAVQAPVSTVKGRYRRGGIKMRASLAEQGINSYSDLAA